MATLLTRSLSVICPSCDFLNVVGAVRCMACGSATDGSSGPRAEPPRPPSKDAGAPPGLKPSPQPRGVPARPTFESSQPQQPAGPKLGLTVLAGPARGQRFKLAATGAQLGRSKGAILFGDDPFVSPLHATITVRDGKLYVRDEQSTSGVYVSIDGQEPLPAGATFATGLRLFRYLGAIEPPAPWNHHEVLVYGFAPPGGQVHYIIEEVLLGDRGGRCLLSPGPSVVIGQGKGELSFPNDEGLAPRHAELSFQPGGAQLKDLSGGLGTFIRITGERALKPGDRLRVGQQTLQVESL